MAKRPTARYQLKGPRGKILHRGITDRELSERRGEHIPKFGDDTAIVQIGLRVSRQTALDWERDGGTRL